jgi:hypothetical protein
VEIDFSAVTVVPTKAQRCPVPVSSHLEPVLALCMALSHIVTRGLVVPRVHVLFLPKAKAWMRGTSPRMTIKKSVAETFIDLFISTGQLWDKRAHDESNCSIHRADAAHPLTCLRHGP